MDINIRRMYLTDLNKVMEIEPIAFGRHHWSYDSFVNELNNPFANYFSAFDANNADLLLGYSGYWLFHEEAHITTLATHHNMRRLGIGEKLLLNDIYTAKELGASWLTLEVRVSNIAAQELYKRYGFKNIGLRKRYYQDNNEDAIILWTDNINKEDYMLFINEKLSSLSIQLDTGIING